MKPIFLEEDIMEFISNLIEKNFEEFLKDLTILVSMKTIEKKLENNTPFGLENKRAIDFILKKAEEYGIRYKNLDYYVCWLEVGRGEEIIGIPVHLDVVPEGNGWETNPFELTKKNGYLYGRGIVDNKGPALIMLYLLRFLKDSKNLKKRIRVIFGVNEETGMQCIQYYLAKGEERPTLGFTPDALYPVVVGEKGRLELQISKNLNLNDELEYLKIEGGEKSNVVPDKACCEIINFENNKLKKIKFKYEGVACHASTPEKGINAINGLIKSILQLKIEKNQTIDILKKLNQLIIEEKNIKLYKKDKEFGDLTLNIGIIKLDRKIFKCKIDIRYPKGITENEILEYLKKFFGKDYQIEIITSKPIHYVSKDSKLVLKLLEIIKKYTNLKEEPLIIGGGTYASYFENIVGFGPKYQNIRTGGHGKNENISIVDLKKNIQIYYEAILGLNEL